jgi:hypothetical protein
MGKSYSKRRHLRTRKQRGGDLAGNPASAWGWGLGTVGDGFTQIMNSLTLQPGQNIATAQSNNLVPVNNINASNPTSSMLQPNMGGGSRRRRRVHRSRSRSRSRGRSRGRGRSSSKRGGNWGAVLNQAAAPLVLLGAQQMYGRRRTKKH